MVQHDLQPTLDTLHSRWAYFPRLLRFLWGLGPREIALLSILSVVGGLLPILDVELLRRLVDSAAGAVGGARPLADALFWLATLMGVVLLEAIFGAVSSSTSTVFQERLQTRAQERLLRKAGWLPLATLEQPEFYDQLQRAQQGIDARMLATLEHLSAFPGNLATAIGLLIYVGSAHILFPIMLLAGLIPSHIVGARLNRQRYELNCKHTPSERMLGYLGRMMTGRQAAAEVRLFGLQQHLFEQRRRLFRQLRAERLRLARLMVQAITLPVVGEQLTYGLVITWLVVLIARGRLSIGHFAAYVGAAERFRLALMMLFSIVRSTDDDLRYIRDLLDYLGLPEEPSTENQEPAAVHKAQTTTNGGRPTTDDGRVTQPATHNTQPIPIIRFEDVTFSYPSANRPALEGVTLALRPCDRVALVGGNGAGKTTLAKLLLGLYRPTSGRITVNGVDLRELDLGWWRRRVAAVFQDYVRYELTVRENIGFGDLGCLHDDRALGAAAAKSGADQVVAALPVAYDTILGKAYDAGGQDLSVGQWQKLAIARAYLRDALVLVLDEPTAALDARGEVEVYRQFRDMAQGKTTLLISHRLGSARLADRIVFLDAGRIVEEGSHAALLAQDGRYAEMYQVQASWYR